MKKILFAVLMIFTTLSIQAKPRDVAGIIVGTNNQPIPFVNVVLLASDSTFVEGAMSGEDGRFNIVTNVNNGILKVSSVGYETLFVNMSEFNGTIILSEDVQVLSEVVVKAQLPKTKLTGNSMITSVQGSVLEKSGTAKEMLADNKPLNEILKYSKLTLDKIQEIAKEMGKTIVA